MSHVKISPHGITDIEFALILALREMPLAQGWCHELGMAVIGEGEIEDYNKPGWGTNLYFAFQAYGVERGEPSV